MKGKSDDSRNDGGLKKGLFLPEDGKNRMQETHGIQAQRESQQLNVHGRQYSMEELTPREEVDGVDAAGASIAVFCYHPTGL